MPRIPAPKFALWFALVAGLLAGAWAQPGSVRAQREFAGTRGQRVIVDQFRGPRASQMRQALIADLEEHGIRVVTSGELREARRSLRLSRSRLRERDYVRLAQELNADAVLTGRIRRRRRRWSGRVLVRGSDGRLLGASTWSGRTAASLGAIRRNGYERLASHLSLARSAGIPSRVSDTARPEQADELPWYAQHTRPEPPVVVEAIEREPVHDVVPAEPEAAPAPSEPEPARSTEGPGEQVEVSPMEGDDRSRRHTAFRLMVFGGTLTRYLNAPVSVYASQRGMAAGNDETDSTNFLTESREFLSPAQFEPGVRMELYPGAFEDQSFPVLGFIGMFSHSLFVQADGYQQETGDDLTIPVQQLEALGALRLRARTGPQRTDLTLWGDLGYGLFHYNLGVSELRDVEWPSVVPPMQHGYVFLGGGMRFALDPTYASLGIDLAIRIGTNIGADTRNVWGIETPPANGLGLGFELRVEIPEVTRGFYLGGRLEYLLFMTDFQGQSGCASAAAGGAACPTWREGGPREWRDPNDWEAFPINVATEEVIGGPLDLTLDHYARAQFFIAYEYY